jgi:hypothetical protein
LTFTRSGDTVSGFYFHASDLKNVRVSGKISGDTRLLLGDFDAEFVESDPREKFPGKLRCQIISGRWRNQPVYLSLESGGAGTPDHMYRIAGAKDDALVNGGALRFWQAVNQGDKATVASLIDYPIRLSVAGNMVAIHSAPELLKQYDAVFTPAYRKAIAADFPLNMFANDRGISLGAGEVWFGVSGRVTMLNNVEKRPAARPPAPH